MSSLLSSLIQQAQDLRTLQYLTVSGAAFFFWDYILVFPRELSYIWCDTWRLRRISKVKLAYIASRYGFPLAFTFLIIDLTSHIQLNNTWLMPSKISLLCRCSVTSTLAMTLILLTELIWHSLLLIRVFILWDRSKTIYRLIIFGAAAAYTTSIAFLIAFVKDLPKSTYIGDGIDVCFTSVIDTSRIIGIELPQVILDLYVLTLISLNALAVPRVAQRTISEILQRDGSTLVAMTWFLRVLNIIFCLNSNMTAGLSGALFTESAIAAINARLFFKLFAKDTSSNYTNLSVITDSSESEYWKRASSFLYLEL